MLLTLIRPGCITALLTCCLSLAGGVVAAPLDADNAEAAPVSGSRAAPLNPLLAQATQYEHGEGVAKDVPKAAELYCSAARQGDAEAAYRLGWIYANGRGLNRDDGYAVALFQVAAAEDHAYALRALEMVRSTDTRLPPCMTPPPPPPRDVDAPLPAHWLTEEKRAKVVELARKLAPEFDVDYRLILGVIAAESGFDANAQSVKNAQGLMQLLPETAERFNIKKILDPVQNMRGGIAYLRWLLAYFKGNVPLVLAAYNAGEGTVDRYGGVPPYAETKQYVERIMKFYGKATHRYNEAVVEASPMLNKPMAAPVNMPPVNIH